MSNMSGAQMRKTNTPLNSALKALSSEEVERLLGNLPAFHRDVLGAVRKHSTLVPKISSLFSSSVSTTLDDGSVITALTLTREWTFREGLTAALGIALDTKLAELECALVEGGHTLSQAHIDEMKRRTDMGEETGMRKGGWGNFYPCQNDAGDVSVGYVYHVSFRWRSNSYRLGYGYRWNARYRLLLRNMDTLML